METLGWIVILIVGLAFAAVIAWLGTLWITTRAGRAMTQIFKPSADLVSRSLAQSRRARTCRVAQVDRGS